LQAHGRYFPTRSAQFVTARAGLAADDAELRLEDAAGVLLAAIPLKRIRISARLGTLPRKLHLPGGACFETPDNDAIDHMLRVSGNATLAGLLHRVEMSWRIVSVAVAVAMGVVAFMALIGVPWFALRLALNTPPAVAQAMAGQTLLALEEIGALAPTTLSPERAGELEQRLARVTAAMPALPAGYRLILKDAPVLGPNAFALPDGRIVMTDQLVALARDDAELEGVLGHEAAHVFRAHGLQRAYQASMIPVMIAFISGDVSTLSQTVTLLPGLLLQTSYSRTFEQQADDDAADALKRIGVAPSHLADLLERIEAEQCGADGCRANWLGTHPETAVRATRLRED
jgi:Zn-dependent protease with chaperone function